MSSPGSGVAQEVEASAQPSNFHNRRVRYIDLGLVLLCTIVPAVFNAVIQLHRSSFAPITTDRFALQALHQVGGLCLLAYVLNRRGRTFRSIGLVPSVRGVGVGVILYFSALLAGILCALQLRMIAKSTALASFHHRDLSWMVSGTFVWVVLAYSTLNPWFEELIVRAFLMTEVTAMSGSVWLAAIVSTLLQASYHLYQGWYNAATIAAMFFVLSIYYAKTRNIFPVICAHMLQDYVASLLALRHLHR